MTLYCVNCLVYNWPIEDVSLLRCSSCKSLSYCSPECQKEHWKKVHRKQCKTLAGKVEVPASTHISKSCPGCKEEQELGTESINSKDCSAWGCLVGLGVERVIKINGIFPSAVESREMTREFPTKAEHTLFVMQQIVNKLMRTNARLSQQGARAELTQLTELLHQKRMEIISQYHYNPAKLMEIGFIACSSLNSEFKEAVISSISTVSSILGTSVEDPFLARETLKLLACFLFGSKMDSIHKSFERLSMEDDLPRDVQKLVRELGTSTKFEMIWDSVLEVLQAGLVHHYILLDILCGGNRKQECNQCQKYVVIERVFVPFVDEPKLEKPFIIFKAMAFSCTAIDCQVASTRKATIFLNQVTTVMNLKVSALGVENICDNCFMLGRRIHRCSQCKTKVYCSEECQMEDWEKIHEKICNEGEVDRKVKREKSERVVAVKKQAEEYIADIEIHSRMDPANQMCLLDIVKKIQ